MRRAPTPATPRHGLMTAGLTIFGGGSAIATTATSATPATGIARAGCRRHYQIGASHALRRLGCGKGDKS